MAIGGDGNLYVANYYSHKVEVFGLDGTHVRTVNSGAEMLNPAWMTIQGDTLIVSSSESDRVLRYDLSDNDRLLDDLVTPYDGFDGPHGIHWKDNGEMLVSTNNGIDRFAADGSYIDRFASEGLVRPTGILDAGDRYIVGDYSGRATQIDKVSGESLGLLDETGAGSDGVFRLPTGEILVAFNLSKQVRWYSADGSPLGNFASRSELKYEGPNAILMVPSPQSGAVLLGGAMLMGRRRRR